ncbi:hypothetical protein [Roseibium sp.]|uniref:hypothetical protein n=1 Tax=Roseibium sp. TaxID=1936156 RepID=UPI003B525737
MQLKFKQVGWRHTITFETGERHSKFSDNDESPFGTPGVDHDIEYVVCSEPIFVMTQKQK